MQINFNFLTIIMTIGIIQSLFLSVFIFKNEKRRNVPKYFLFTILIVSSLIYLYGAIYISRNNELLIATSPFLLPIFTLIGPLIYLYIYATLNNEFRLKPRYLLFFLPFLLSLIYFSRIYFLPAKEQTLFLNSIYENEKPVFNKIVIYFSLLYRTIFLFYSYKLINTYQRNLKDIFASISSFDFSWMKNLLLFYSSTIVLGFLIATFNLSDNLRIINSIYLTIIFYIMAYKFMKEPISQKLVNELISQKKYQKSGLDDNKKEEIEKKLTLLMETEKLYLNSEVSASYIAEKMEISINHLSQVLNETFNKNFYEFINTYRIDKAKELLKSVESPNILTIAYESGFNSKSTFNVVFKKITGLTPTQFKNQNK